MAADEPVMSSLAPFIRRSPIISSLPVELLNEIEKVGEEISFRRRQIVFMAEQKTEYVYLLTSGRVKLVRVSPTGREITIGLVNPMEIFGENDLFEYGATYGVGAEVLEDAEVVAIRRAQLAEAIGQCPEALKELAILQYSRRLQAENRLTEYAFYDVPTRVARLLVRLSCSHGRNSKSGSVIRIKLTHQEIANLIGSTRETTTLILNDFRRRGIIDLQGRRIVVADPQALQQLTH